MSKFLHRAIRLMTLSLLCESQGASAEMNGTFHWIAAVFDSSLNWRITANPGSVNLLGTFQNAGFSVYHYNSTTLSGSVAPYVRQSAENCTLPDWGFQTLYVPPSQAYYFYIEKGASCSKNGALQITQLALEPGVAPREVQTMTVTDFESPDLEIGIQPERVHPPLNNRFKTDVVTIHHKLGQNNFTVSRARLQLGQDKIPQQFNMTTKAFDLQLKELPVLNPHSRIDVGQFQNGTANNLKWLYVPPYLVTGTISSAYTSLSVNIFTMGALSHELLIADLVKHVQTVQEFVFYPYNETAVLLYCLIETVSLPLRKVRELHVISFDGNREQLPSIEAQDLIHVLALQQDHGPYARGGVLSLDRLDIFAPPRLVYTCLDQLPIQAFLPKVGPENIFNLAESNETIHIGESEHRGGFGNHLGNFDLDLKANTPTSTTLATSRTAPSTTLHTNSSSFFSVQTNGTVSQPSQETSGPTLIIGTLISLILLSFGAYATLLLRQFCQGEQRSEQEEIPLLESIATTKTHG